MKFEELMTMYDNWNGILVVNDDNLNCITKGKTVSILETRKDLYDKEVITFGFCDGEFCVRVRLNERLLEIAQKAISKLIYQNREDALRFCEDALILTKEEAEIFGIDYEEMKKHSQWYEGGK